MPYTIWWIRRDLRLSDNQALVGAAAHGTVIPVYLLDPHLLQNTSFRRQAFLIEGLRALDAGLQERGSRLIVRAGEPSRVLASLIMETSAQSVWAEEDISPYALARDERVSREVPLRLVGGRCFFSPGEVVKANGEPYSIFTPYSRAWMAKFPARLSLLPAPERLDPLPFPSDSLPASTPQPGFPAGEVEALRRLQAFREEKIIAYAATRDRIDLEGTSLLSPYLRFGMLSIRQAVSAAMDGIRHADGAKAASAETWLKELIWREFYASILYHFPHVLRGSFRSGFHAIAWGNDPTALEAWMQGLTGCPIVDAGMRQLAQTGWIHNRVRMITASYLVKDLLVDWRLGERWFMQHLIDGDPASNNGGWQWVAGTGTDAAPYFRIFNPILQSQKYDPQGMGIRRWVPELAGVPTRYIHAPWTIPEDLQRECGCIIGRDYPFPLIDHDFARLRALDAYKKAALRD